MNSIRSHSLQRTALASILLLVAACGGGGGGRANAPPPTTTPTPSPPPATDVAATSPYVADAPYAGALRRCTYAGSATVECSLGELPFLGMETTSPTIADVMGRTLVSERWMGDNLQATLQALPADLLPLFRSITAVVIATDVRPAYYDPETGAIYLDPEFLWLSVRERDQVPDTPDPRSDFGRDLAFEMPWRYVRNGQPLTVYVNPDGSRDPDQIVEILGYLLFHELAHAVDFVPPARMPGLRAAQTVLGAINSDRPLSSDFVSAYPLASDTLKGLAAVSFLGEDSTAAQRALTPGDLVNDFANDGATQYYAYTTQYEDFATQFETVMMKWHFGYDKDTAIAHPSTTGRSSDAVVVWGERGRIGGQQVLVRALDVGQRMYPGDLAAFESFLSGQPAPRTMTPGDTWEENLVLAPVGAQAVQPASSGIDTRRPDRFLERVRIR
jgi:hypothetical protein